MADVLSHYRTQLGEPDAVAEYAVSGDQPVKVLTWNPDSTDWGVALYTTVGASERSHHGHRVEFVLGLLPGADEVRDSLAALATFPLYKQALGFGETVTLPQAILPDTHLHTYLVLPPEDPTIPPLTLPDRTHVQFLEVIPIHPEELKWKKEFGAEWLLERMAAQRLWFTDPRRRPIQHPWVVR